MGLRNILSSISPVVSRPAGWVPSLTWHHRPTSLILLFSFTLQPFGISAESKPPVPLAHFAPQKSRTSVVENPFIWTSPDSFHALPSPRSPRNGTLADSWKSGVRPAAREMVFQPAAALASVWQPAAVSAQSDENTPLAPPDGMPLAPLDGTPGPAINGGIGNCIIQGEVSDATSLNPVAGAFVDAVGTGRTAETDAQGRFTLAGLPTGTFTLEATKLGYFAETSVTTTIETQPAEVRFGLRIKPADDASEETTLEEETIVGEYQEESQGNLFVDLQSGGNIAAGISKEEFTQAAVSDAAGAVAKISGANIVGGKYAVVRGLGDRYSNTLVNGALISSADPSKKAVQLDLFPTDLLQSVAINKTFTPDLPAEFAGGIVLVETLRLPEKRIIEFELGIGTNSNLGSTFYENPDGDRDYWGKRDDKIPLGGLPEGILSPGWTGRRAPGVRPEGGVSQSQQLEMAAESAAEMQAVHLSGGMTPKKRDPNEKLNYAITLGDIVKLDNGIELGGVVAFTHEAGDKVIENIKTGRGIDFGTDSVPGNDGRPGSDDYVVRTQTEDRYTEFLNWGLLLGAGVKLGDQHEIGFTSFHNTSTEDEVVLGRKIREIGGNFPEYLPSESNPFGAGAYAYQAFDSINPLVRELSTLQLDGTHQFGESARPIRLDWMVAGSTALEDRPNGRSSFFSQLDFADPRIENSGDVYSPTLGTVYTAADPFGSNPPLVESFRESLKTDEEAGNESLDLTIPVWNKSDDDFFDIKVGTNHFNRDRKVRGRLFTYGISPVLNNTLLGNNGQYGVDYLDQLDSPTAPDGTPRFGGWTGPQANSQSGQMIISEATLLGRTVRNVDAGNEIKAFYLMGNSNIGDWGLVGGVRLEDEERYYQVLPDINPIAFVNDSWVRTRNEYALPGVTLWRNFGDEDEFKALFAWSKTVARPTFYEYAPVEIEDQSTGDIIVGNPDLTDTLITNFDLRFDWNATDQDRFSINLFHKSMTAPIAQSYDLEKKTWVNGESGQLTGYEVEANRDLGLGFSLTANYTYIDSLLRYDQKINSSGLSQTVDSTFEGQPENIFNLILGYEHGDLGFKSSLVYNFTGSYLTGVPATVESPTIIRESYQSLDFVLSKSFQLKECDGRVTLKITNLLDSEDRQVFAPTDLVYKSFSPGRGLSLSADFEF